MTASESHLTPIDNAETVARPHRHLCPEADYRDTLTDDEFWAHVFHQDDGPDTEGPDDQDFYDMRSPYGRPCDVCGEAGPCGYDTEGRPMIHTEEEANPDG